MNLLFATQNSNKAAEIQKLMPAGFAVKSLADLGIHDDIPETGSTLKENALIKARYVHQKFGKSCFADDTGLEIDALNGRPGVFSARYAGEEKNADANMNKVLAELESKSNRKACFKTVIALILDTEEYLFEGIVEGIILKNKVGTDGFGYDPIFKPSGYDFSFAQMTLEEKNKISHRGRAIAKMIDFLNTLKLN